MRYCWMLLMGTLCACGGGSSSSTSSAAAAPAPDVKLIAPQNVTLSGPPNAISIAWDPVEGAEQYNVYYSSDMNMSIATYAAYPDSGLVQLAAAPAVINLTGTQIPMFFMVTAEDADEESAGSAMVVAPLSLQVNTFDSSLIDDHTSGIQWNRCPDGMTWDAGIEACTGIETVITDTLALSQFGYEPPAIGARPPTEEEIWAMAHCGVPWPAGALGNPGPPSCETWLTELFPARGAGYPPYFVYSESEYSGPGKVCRTGVRREYQAGAGCASPYAGDVRSFRVQPMP